MVNARPIYSDKTKPMRVVVLFSGGASGARYLFSKNRSEKTNYEIVAGITDNEDSPGVEVFSRRNLPVKVVSKKNFFSNSGQSPKSKYGYFKKLTGIVKEYEPDLLFLSGFMQVIRQPLLRTYAGRMLNVHPADLTIKKDGERKYRGDDAVYEAILAGEHELRSTVHFVTKQVDKGPIVVVSKPVSIERRMVRTFQKFNENMVRKYADLVQEWMKWVCDGPSIHQALTLIEKGKVRYSRGDITLKGPNGFATGYYDLQEGGVVLAKGQRS